jgi:hypothetical protein
MAEKTMGDTTLPASWFTNEKFFELENRAIFSKVSNSKFTIFSTKSSSDLNSHGFWQCIKAGSASPEITSDLILPGFPLSSSWRKMELFKLSTMCAAIEHTQSSIKILGVR